LGSVCDVKIANLQVLLKVGQRAPTSGQGLDPLALRQRRQLYRSVWFLSATCAFEALALLPWTAPFDQHGDERDNRNQDKQKEQHGEDSGSSIGNGSSSSSSISISSSHHRGEKDVDDDSSSLLLVEADNVCGGLHTRSTPQIRNVAKNELGRKSASGTDSNAGDDDGGSEENGDVGCSGNTSRRTHDTMCCHRSKGGSGKEGSGSDIEMALARSLQNRNTALASLAHSGTFSSNGVPASNNEVFAPWLNDTNSSGGRTGPVASLDDVSSKSSNKNKRTSGKDDIVDSDEEYDDDDDDDDEGAFLDGRGLSSSSVPANPSSRTTASATGTAALLTNALPFSSSNTALMLPGDVATGGGILPSKWLAACSLFLMVLENVCGIILQVNLTTRIPCMNSCTKDTCRILLPFSIF